MLCRGPWAIGAVGEMPCLAEALERSLVLISHLLVRLLNLVVKIILVIIIVIIYYSSVIFWCASWILGITATCKLLESGDLNWRLLFMRLNLAVAVATAQQQLMSVSGAVKHALFPTAVGVEEWHLGCGNAQGSEELVIMLLRQLGSNDKLDVADND